MCFNNITLIMFDKPIVGGEIEVYPQIYTQNYCVTYRKGSSVLNGHLNFV